MSSQLSNQSPTLPPAGTPAVVPGSPGGLGTPAISLPTSGLVAPTPPTVPSTPVTGGGAVGTDDPRVIAALQQIIGVVNQLIAVASAQAGAAAITGGGGNNQGGATVDPAEMRAEAAGGGGGLGGGMTWSSGFSFDVSGGGGVSGGGPSDMTGSTGSAGMLAPSSLGGTTGSGWSIMDTSGTPMTMEAATQGAAAAPVAVAAQPAAPAATGGGAVASSEITSADAKIDYRRLLGTPAAGGVIDTVLKHAMPMAGAAMSEGTYIVLTDANGAQLQVHAHGIYGQHPELIPAAIQAGKINVHLHNDGTLHLHDVVA
jgi:hypothetical protein